MDGFHGTRGKKRILLAIGGNALVESDSDTIIDQMRKAGETAGHVASLVKAGHEVVITHGNGPQVGFSMLRSELARGRVHEVPLQICVAETQGTIGYQIAQTLQNTLHEEGIHRLVTTILTRVVVHEGDPAFEHPTKPVGSFLSDDEAKKQVEENKWAVKHEKGRGTRRVVASPRPLEIIEVGAIRTLADAGVIVVAVGGGGVPVIRKPDGTLQGVAAVIDKDASSCLLAKAIDADVFLLTTQVDHVSLHFGTDKERPLRATTITDVRRFIDDGHFAAGSMRPKMEAAISFLEAPGVGRRQREVIITSPNRIADAFEGSAGTRVRP